MRFLDCPRCGSQAYEKLATHAHCALCNFSPTFDYVEQELQDLEAVLKHADIKPAKLKDTTEKVWLPGREEELSGVQEKKPPYFEISRIGAMMALLLTLLCSCQQRTNTPSPSQEPHRPNENVEESAPPFEATILQGERYNDYSVKLSWNTEIKAPTWYVYKAKKGEKPAEFAILKGNIFEFTDKTVRPGYSYEYLLAYTENGDFAVYDRKTITVPKDHQFWRSGWIGESYKYNGINRLFFTKNAAPHIGEDNFAIEVNEIVSDGGTLKTFRKGAVAGPQKLGERNPTGLLHIKAKRGRGFLKVIARGYQGFKGARYDEEYFRLDGTHGGNTPNVLIEIEEESPIDFDIQRIPGPGGKPIENGRPGEDGNITPYCIRIGSSSFGDCHHFSSYLKKEGKHE